MEIERDNAKEKIRKVKLELEQVKNENKMYKI